MIYFITQGDEYVKIGYCSKNPTNRLSCLQVGNPAALELRAVMGGHLGTEAMLHERFKRYHIRGEWFRLSDEIRQYVQQLVLDDGGDVAEGIVLYGASWWGTIKENHNKLVAMRQQFSVK